MQHEIQGVAFDRSEWGATEAAAWASAQGFQLDAPDHTDQYWRWHQDADRWADYTREVLEGGALPVHLIIGHTDHRNPATLPDEDRDRLARLFTKEIRYYSVPEAQGRTFEGELDGLVERWGYQQDLFGAADVPGIQAVRERGGWWTVNTYPDAHRAISQAARRVGGRSTKRPPLRLVNPCGEAVTRCACTTAGQFWATTAPGTDPSEARWQTWRLRPGAGDAAPFGAEYSAGGLDEAEAAMRGQLTEGRIAPTENPGGGSRFEDRREESKAIKRALKDAGIASSVRQGQGTAWGWVTVDVGYVDREHDPQTGEAAAWGQAYHADLGDETARIVREVTGRGGEWGGQITIGWSNRKIKQTGKWDPARYKAAFEEEVAAAPALISGRPVQAEHDPEADFAVEEELLPLGLTRMASHAGLPGYHEVRHASSDKPLLYGTTQTVLEYVQQLHDHPSPTTAEERVTKRGRASWWARAFASETECPASFKTKREAVEWAEVNEHAVRERLGHAQAVEAERAIADALAPPEPERETVRLSEALAAASQAPPGGWSDEDRVEPEPAAAVEYACESEAADAGDEPEAHGAVREAAARALGVDQDPKAEPEWIGLHLAAKRPTSDRIELFRVERLAEPLAVGKQGKPYVYLGNYKVGAGERARRVGEAIERAIELASDARRAEGLVRDEDIVEAVRDQAAASRGRTHERMADEAAAADAKAAERIPGLVIVGCVGEKGTTPAPAGNLYTSPLFRKRRAYAEGVNRPWLVLSARYGLVDPAEVVEPYDVQIGDLAPEERAELVKQIRRKAATLGRAPAGGHLAEVHAGAPYVELLREALPPGKGWSFRHPVEGLRVGEQLAWYGPNTYVDAWRDDGRHEIERAIAALEADPGLAWSERARQTAVADMTKELGHFGVARLPEDVAEPLQRARSSYEHATYRDTPREPKPSPEGLSYAEYEAALAAWRQPVEAGASAFDAALVALDVPVGALDSSAVEGARQWVAEGHETPQDAASRLLAAVVRQPLSTQMEQTLARLADAGPEAEVSARSVEALQRRGLVDGERTVTTAGGTRAAEIERVVPGDIPADQVEPDVPARPHPVSVRQPRLLSDASLAGALERHGAALSATRAAGVADPRTVVEMEKTVAGLMREQERRRQAGDVAPVNSSQQVPTPAPALALAALPELEPEPEAVEVMAELPAGELDRVVLQLQDAPWPPAEPETGPPSPPPASIVWERSGQASLAPGGGPAIVAELGGQLRLDNPTTVGTLQGQLIHALTDYDRRLSARERVVNIYRLGHLFEAASRALEEARVAEDRSDRTALQRYREAVLANFTAGFAPVQSWDRLARHAMDYAPPLSQLPPPAPAATPQQLRLFNPGQGRWLELFDAVASRQVGGGEKSTGADEKTWKGFYDGAPVTIRTTIRAVTAGEHFLTTSGHRLRGGRQGQGGHFIDAVVLQGGDALNPGQLCELGAWIHEADESHRPVLLRLRGVPLPEVGVGHERVSRPVTVLTRPQARRNPSGFPGTGTVCVDPKGRKVSCRKPGATATDLVLYRPRMPDGSRPRIYLSGADPLVMAGRTVAQRLAELRDQPPPRMVRPPAPRRLEGALGGLEGAACPVFIADPSGCPATQSARYRLVEVAALVPSHKGDNFAPHPDYPAGVQERQYHRDRSEQLKVIQQAGCFQPSLMVNTNPDAVNGPPLATTEGVILGGNSRTMTLQRIYETDAVAADRYRKELRERARSFGFYPGNVDELAQPALVRVVKVDDPTPERLRELVRLYNEALTQEMDPTAMQVATATKITATVVEVLAGTIGPEQTFNAYLASAASRPLLDALHHAGVLDRRNWSRFVNDDTGLLNEDGRTFVSRALVGRVLPDPTVLDLMGPRLRESLAASVPAILSAAANGAKWDVTEDLLPAARVAVSMRAAGYDDIRAYAAQADFEAQPVDDLTELQTTLVDIMVHRAGKLQMQRGFRKWAALAAQYPEGQALLSFVPPPEPLAALRACFKL